MSTGAIIQRTWRVVWDHRFMIGMGLLISFGEQLPQSLPFIIASPFLQTSMMESYPAFADMPGMQDPAFQRMMLMSTAFNVIFYFVIGIPLWILSRTALGGVIATSVQIDSGQPAGFGDAIRAGWARKWPMLGIGLLGAIPPALLYLGVSIYTTSVMGDFFQLMMSMSESNTPEAMMPQLLQFYGVVIAITFIGWIITLPFVIWTLLAERACVLNQTGVIDSYRQGWNVLVDNIGGVLAMLLVQIGLGLAISFVMMLVWLLIGIGSTAIPCLFVLACVFIPAVFVASGLMVAGFQTMWTLGWQGWTGSPQPPEAAAPAV